MVHQKPIDRMEMGPTREEKKVEGGWVVSVTPPSWSGFSRTHYVQLTNDQHQRYMRWRDEGALIQHALPELSGAQREILMTGIGPEEFPQPEEE